jgi:hypothetical protein
VTSNSTAWSSFGFASLGNYGTVFRRILLLTNVLLGLLLATAANAQEASTTESCAVTNIPQRIRPDAGGPPVRISVGVFLLDILDIRESDESFDADFVLRFRWHDPRLSSNALGSSLEHCEIALHEIWNPQVDIINQGNEGSSGWQQLEIDAVGAVQFDRRVTATMTTPFDLGEFPRDTQQLVIRLGSLLYGPEDVILAVDGARTGRIQFASHSGWEIVSNLSNVMPTLEIAGGTSHVRIFHTVLVKRLFGYWFWKLIVPLSLIVLMAWCIFWLDPEAYRSQIAVGASAIFTLIAFQLSLADTLPRISYLTDADKLVMLATLLVFFALGKAVLSSRLVLRDQLDRARRYDAYGRWIYPVLYLIGGVIALY